METVEKFKRVVIEFDEIGFESERNLIERYCEEANLAIETITSEYDLPLTDAEIQSIFIELNSNPSGMIEGFFSGLKSKTLREEAVEDLKEFIDGLLFNLRQFDNKVRNAIHAKKGRLVIDELKMEAVKRKFEKALESQRAYDLYNQHTELFEKYTVFMKEANISTFTRLWYEDHNSDFQKEDLDYNKI